MCSGPEFQRLVEQRIMISKFFHLSAPISVQIATRRQVKVTQALRSTRTRIMDTKSCLSNDTSQSQLRTTAALSGNSKKARATSCCHQTASGIYQSSQIAQRRPCLADSTSTRKMYIFLARSSMSMLTSIKATDYYYKPRQ